jgi:mannose-6-phosphate isomerase-like protein (cupin superfamily)
VKMKRRLLLSYPIVATMALIAACSHPPAATGGDLRVPGTLKSPSMTSAALHVLSAKDGDPPEPGKEMTHLTMYETPHTVTEVLRFAPNADAPQHYHPSYDEIFFVQQGHMVLNLDGDRQDLRSGNFVVIPAGTTITPLNMGPGEAQAVVVYSNTGMVGPLSVMGPARR